MKKSTKISNLAAFCRDNFSDFFRFGDNQALHQGIMAAQYLATMVEIPDESQVESLEIIQMVIGGE